MHVGDSKNRPDTDVGLESYWCVFIIPMQSDESKPYIERELP